MKFLYLLLLSFVMKFYYDKVQPDCEINLCGLGPHKFMIIAPLFFLILFSHLSSDVPLNIDGNPS